MQYAVMTIAAFIIGGIVMHELAGKTLAVPEGWDHPFFGWRLNLDWTGFIAEVNQKISEDQISLIMMLMLFKGIFASAASPAPNHDMQKVLATRSPAEAGKMSGFLNAYQISKDEAFLEAAGRCWDFIDRHIIDRTDGEWFWPRIRGRESFS